MASLRSLHLVTFALLLGVPRSALGSPAQLDLKDEKTCTEFREKVLHQFKKFHLGDSESERTEKAQRRCRRSRAIRGEIYGTNNETDSQNRPTCEAIYIQLDDTVNQANEKAKEACVEFEAAKAAAAACQGQKDCLQKPAEHIKVADAKLKEVRQLVGKVQGEVKRLKDLQEFNLKAYVVKLRTAADLAKVSGIRALDEAKVSEKPGALSVRQFLAKYEDMPNPTPSDITQRADKIESKLLNPGDPGQTFDDARAGSPRPELGLFGSEATDAHAATIDFQSASSQLDAKLGSIETNLQKQAAGSIGASTSLASLDGAPTAPTPRVALAQSSPVADPSAAPVMVASLSPGFSAPATSGSSQSSTGASSPIAYAKAAPASAAARADGRAAPVETGARARETLAPAMVSPEFQSTATAGPVASDGEKNSLAPSPASAREAGPRGISSAPEFAPTRVAYASADSSALPSSFSHGYTPKTSRDDEPSPPTTKANGVENPFETTLLPRDATSTGLRDALRRSLASKSGAAARERAKKAPEDTATTRAVGEMLHEVNAQADRQAPFVLGSVDAEVRRLTNDPDEASGLLGTESRDLFERVRSALRRFEKMAR
jgi:hypothetical protein